MYQAKVAGKNRYHVFDAVQDSSLRSHHESLGRIRLALENHEFVLHYQPKVNMHTGQVVGAEALILWQHPENSLTRCPPRANEGVGNIALKKYSQSRGPSALLLHVNSALAGGRLPQRQLS
jgi:predicted signal transduction protein with EAL and GGDEF domain